ncbi:PorT family protein [Spirosoma sp. RP8]|uniref:PorT family protein n=1 Tax=Spirosoma liriopis TaxID=2937440 RepID=A0ABT0HJ09_9BACT|nr:outer membrane beta-barrel protein [Spirosoma liriopis]MCK8492132.1 PorT family protein [Spirosoma liriopis]
MRSMLSLGALLAILVLPVCVVYASPAHTADSLVIRFANRTRLVIYAPDKAGIQALSNYDLNKIVREMSMKLDSVPGGETAISRDGGRYLKDTVLVVTKKKDGVTIVISGKSDSTRSDSAKNLRDYKRSSVRRGINSWSRSIDFQIGLNTFISQSTLAAYPSDVYSLKPIGSRYFAVAFSQRPTFINGKRAKLSLYYALEGSWNNYMFDNNVVATKGPSQLEFVQYPEQLKKSKLTTFALQLPVVPRISFYNSSGRKVFHLGLGGFIGYRLDSYTKIKRLNNDKEHEHANFYLNNFRYGLVGHIGIVRTSLFVKYDLNPVFQEGKGPDVRTLSFGISF